MKATLFRIIASFLLVSWVALLVCGCSGPGNDTGHKTIRIAANLPMTGPLAIYGQSIKDGAEMAIEDFRKTDPSGPGFFIDWQDNAGDPQRAVTIFQRQMMSEYDIYWSGVNPQTRAIQDQIDAKALPHFVWVFNSSLNKNKDVPGGIKNTFRTWVNFKIEPAVLLNCIKSRKAKRVAIVYVQLPNTEEEYQHIVLPALKQMKINDVLTETYDPKLGDYKAIAVKVRDFKPDLIILSGFQENFVGLIRAMRPFGLTDQGKLICSYDLLDAAKLLGKDELEGLRVVAPIFATHENSPRIKGWSERFRKKTSRSPLYTNAFAYDAICIIYDAAHRMILPASSEQWIQALQETKIDGVTGPCVFDDDGSLVTPIEMAVYRNGVPVPESH